MSKQPGGRREEIRRLLETGKQRGLTYAEIAASAGIAPSTLATWAWRIRRERKQDPARSARFVELVPEKDVNGDRVEITLVTGRRISVATSIDRQQLADIVTALESC